MSGEPTKKFSNKQNFFISILFLVIAGVLTYLLHQKATTHGIELTVKALLGFTLLLGLLAILCGLKWLSELAWARKHWPILTTLFVALVLAGGSFYWFSLRPSKINKNCSNHAISYANRQPLKVDKNVAYLTAFDACRHSKGL